MERNRANIYQNELLITLDYLLNHTDSEHPASTVDICKHAKKYGLKYNGGVAGDDVKRQRIGICLKRLKKLSDTYSDVFPFILETTKEENGKYYIDQKNGLFNEQIAQILAAIKNDRYTKDADVVTLTNAILRAFSSSEHEQAAILNEYKRLIRGVKKYDDETMKKISIIDKAFKENKLVRVNLKNNDYWFKVYLVKEYKGKPNAFLLPTKPINGKTNNYIFDDIENINIVKGPNGKYLNDNDVENSHYKDADILFRNTNPKLAEKYGTLDNMITKMIAPKGGKTTIVSFSFKLKYKDLISRSFENHFSESFRYQETNLVDGLEEMLKEDADKMNNWIIVTEEPEKNAEPTHGLVNISVDNDSFISWLLSNCDGRGYDCVADKVSIIKPKSINEELVNYYADKVYKRVKYLNKEVASALYNRILDYANWD